MVEVRYGMCEMGLLNITKPQQIQQSATHVHVCCRYGVANENAISFFNNGIAFRQIN